MSRREIDADLSEWWTFSCSCPLQSFFLIPSRPFVCVGYHLLARKKGRSSSLSPCLWKFAGCHRSMIRTWRGSIFPDIGTFKPLSLYSGYKLRDHRVWLATCTGGSPWDATATGATGYQSISSKKIWIRILVSSGNGVFHVWSLWTFVCLSTLYWLWKIETLP